jgi:hypothetical protein
LVISLEKIIAPLLFTMVKNVGLSLAPCKLIFTTLALGLGYTAMLASFARRFNNITLLNFILPSISLTFNL